MKLVIPSSFKLAGHTYSVKFQKDLLTTDNEFGSLNEVTHVMTLQPPDPVPQSRVESTFLHELLHAIFYELGESELDKNERLIDSVANLLYQAFVSAEGDLLKFRNRDEKDE
ncbi:MAG: hypothetical protein EBU90_20665 [Proteobacteria bacterium]|nr:hypothetical protein [Pseudomonadota bacterium]NBP15463.1 hypothetical protein [bacterium]